MYAIQVFVLQKMKEKVFTKTDLIKSAGYSNITKGIRRLDSFLAGDEYPQFLIDNLHTALDEPKELIIEKLRITDLQIKEKDEQERLIKEDFERRNFVPYLFCHTENKIPSQIFVCAILGADRLRFLELPLNFNSLSPEEQTSARNEVISYMMKKYNGMIPTFGSITCFTQRLYYDDTPDSREVYGLNGEKIDEPDSSLKLISTGRASISYKGKDIGFLFKRFNGD